MKKSKGKSSKKLVKKMRLLKVHEQRLAAFLSGVDDYDFQIREYPQEFHQTMDIEDFLLHFYSIAHSFSMNESDVPIGKLFVLYGVSTFEQKKKVNRFLISFLISLERYYFESNEVEFALEVVNAFIGDTSLLKRKLMILIKIKQRITHHYINNKDRLDYPLDGLIVNCNDWANLFKSFTFLFRHYETSLIKRIVKKFSDMKIKENNNVRASIFARAVFLLQEEEDQEMGTKSNKFMMKEMNVKKKRKKNRKAEEFLKESLFKERQKFIKSSGTMARNAQREQNEYQKMYNLSEVDTQALMKMDNEKLYKDLESLDQIIYKEGRIKRNRQNLLDSMLSKLKDCTNDYDELFSVALIIEKKYRELLRYGRDVCPDALQGMKVMDTKKLGYFKKHQNLYERAIKLNMLK